MDVVTHSLIGLIGAGPFLERSPEAALAFALGSVAPDFDALSRQFGKRAYFRCHQTYTHALPVIVLLGVVAGSAVRMAGLPGFWIGAGLTMGMVLHSMLDCTNTLGITLFTPFSHKRYCLEWVFFIDITVIALLAVPACLVLPALWRREPVGWPAPAACAASLAAYWLFKGWLRRRAGKLAPSGTVTLLPSGVVPWRFLGCARSENDARLFRLSGFTGRVSEYDHYLIQDGGRMEVLATVAEFRLMRLLSPAYHLVRITHRDDGETLLCRDLRTRNFGTRFGDLEVDVDSTGKVKGVRWHV
jgi:membrane-bound metal-dependent hydrolase YbcI (DUF457 family)